MPSANISRRVFSADGDAEERPAAVEALLLPAAVVVFSSTWYDTACLVFQKIGDCLTYPT